jgi:hypothetical protein
MRRMLVLASVLASYSGLAHAEADQTCLGFTSAPNLKILWDKAAVVEDGKYMQMQQAPTVSNWRHLVGHGISLKQRGIWVEITEGGPKIIRYRCYPGLGRSPARSSAGHSSGRGGGGRG